MNDIKVIEPISKHTKEFDTVDEFNLYYNKNKEEMDKLTTHKLNKLYLIKGYRITRIKNVLSLKKMKQNSQYEIDLGNELDELKKEIQQIREITKLVEPMKETINNIIHFLNPQTEIEVSPPSDTCTIRQE